MCTSLPYLRLCPQRREHGLFPRLCPQHFSRTRGSSFRQAGHPLGLLTTPLLGSPVRARCTCLAEILILVGQTLFGSSLTPAQGQDRGSNFPQVDLSPLREHHLVQHGVWMTDGCISLEE